MTGTLRRSYRRSAAAAAWSGLLAAFNANKTSWIGLAMFLAVCSIAVLAPWLAPHDPLEQNILYRLKEPNAEYVLGTDYYGRDTLSRASTWSTASMRKPAVPEAGS